MLADRLVLRDGSVPAGGVLEVVVPSAGWLLSARFPLCDGVLCNIAVMRLTPGKESMTKPPVLLLILVVWFSMRMMAPKWGKLMFVQMMKYLRTP